MKNRRKKIVSDNMLSLGCKIFERGVDIQRKMRMEVERNDSEFIRNKLRNSSI